MYNFEQLTEKYEKLFKKSILLDHDIQKYYRKYGKRLMKRLIAKLQFVAIQFLEENKRVMTYKEYIDYLYEMKNQNKTYDLTVSNEHPLTVIVSKSDIIQLQKKETSRKRRYNQKYRNYFRQNRNIDPFNYSKLFSNYWA